MRPRAYERLNAQLNALEAMTSLQQRGVQFEKLLAAMFSADQFAVSSNVRSAGGSQVDLVASRGALTVLVEAKWRDRKAGPDEVNRLLDRLESSPSAVAGVLISMSGFTSTVSGRVKAKGKTPILLLDGNEIQACVRGASVYDLLTSKLDYLARRQEVLMTTRPGKWDTLTTTMRGSTLMLRLPGERETRWWESHGGFHDSVFALNLDDVDGGVGEGSPVECDLDFPVGDATELSHLVSTLEAFDWLSTETAWRFEQAPVSWNGFGTTTLIQALLGYDDRYRGRPMHHTERLLATDEFGAGTLTLTADVSARTSRMVTRCQVSLQLPGVPLDTSAIQTLAREYEVTNYPVFRPLNRPSVATHALTGPRGPNKPKDLTQYRSVGDIIRTGDPEASSDIWQRTRAGSAPGFVSSPGQQRSVAHTHDAWVVGVILNDPFPRSGRARRLLDLPTERLGPVCGWLRSHHLPHDENTYSVLKLQHARTSDANVFRLICDW